MLLLGSNFICFYEEGSGRGRDKGQEKGLFQKATPIRLIHFPNNLEHRVFLKKLDFDEHVFVKYHFFS